MTVTGPSGTILLLPVLRLEGSPLEFSERRSVTFSSLCNICRQLVGRMGTILQEDVCVQRGLVRTGGKAIVKSPKAQRQPIPLESAALQCSRTVALRNAGIQNEDGRHLTAKDDSGVVLVGHKGLEPLTTRLRVWWLYFSISPLRWTFDAASCSSPSFLLLICCLPEFRRAEPIFFAASSFLSSAMWT